MTAEQAAPPLRIDPSLIGNIELGDMVVQYVDLEDEPFIRSTIDLGGRVYTYERTFPIKGHSAIMPEAVAERLAEGRFVLVAERDERYYLYVS